MLPTDTPLAAPAFDLRDPGLIEDPYPRLAELRRAQPVHRFAWEGRPVRVLTRYAECGAVLADARFGPPDVLAPPFALGGERSLPADLLRQTGPMTSSVLPDAAAEGPLLAEILAAAAPRIQACADGLLERLGRSGGDLVLDLVAPLAVVAVCEVLDVPAADRPLFHVWMPELGRASGLPREVFRARTRAQSAVRVLFEVLESRSRAVPLPCEQSDVPAATEARASAALRIAFSGYEAGVGLLGNGLLALVRRPEARAAAAADPETAADEILRFDPPVQVATRQAREAAGVAGEALEAGERLWLLLGSANRDEAVFGAAAGFDPGRARHRPPALLADAAGPGHRIARALANAILPRLPELPELALRPGLARRPSAALRMLERLPVAPAGVSPLARDG